MKKKETLFDKFCDALLMAAVTICLNKAYNDFASRKHKLTALPENYYNWKGVKIYFEKKGAGSPVILLHALHPAASSYEWVRVRSSLAENHTVYTLDLPGCGRSGKQDVMYTNFYYVQMLHDFIKDHGIRKPAVIASNLSASIAVMYSAYDAESISRIILINPPATTEMQETPNLFSRIRYRVLHQSFIGSVLYSIMTSRHRIELAFTERYFYNPFHDSDELVDTYFESAHLGDGKGHFFAACLSGRYLNVNLDHAIKGLNIPVRIIEGAESWGAEEIVDEWTDLNPHIETVFIDRTRELPMLEEPEKTAWEIESFL